jgi:hypothetical protein
MPTAFVGLLQSYLVDYCQTTRRFWPNQRRGKLKHVFVIAVILVALVQGCDKCDVCEPCVPPKCDQISPVIQVFEIEDDEGVVFSSSVTLSIAATDNGGGAGMSMRISEDPTFHSATWVPYQTTTAFDIEGLDAEKVIFAQVRDAAGNLSETVADETILAENSTVVHCLPDTLALPPSQSSTVVVRIENAMQLVSAQIVITFDPASVEIMNVDVETAPDQILTTTGASIIVSDLEIDNIKGRLTIGALAQQDGFTGVSGDGAFAVIGITAKGAATGYSVLAFEQCTLFNHPVGIPPDPASNVIAINGHLEHTASRVQARR